MDDFDDLDDDNSFLLWSVYCCPAYQGESYDDWLVRAKDEYQDEFHPVDPLIRKGHGGYGLKPKTV